MHDLSWEFPLELYPKGRWACNDTLNEGVNCCFHLIKGYMACVFWKENMSHPIWLYEYYDLNVYLCVGK